METEILALCDAATTQSGKLNILGAFSVLKSPQAPITVPHVCIAARLRFMKLEEGPKQLRLAVVDADGKPVIPTINAPLNVAMNPTATTANFDLVLGIQPLTLPRFGEYSVDLAVNGRVEKSIPLFVRQSGQQPALPPVPPPSSPAA